jgi:ABC-2 type transport system permease protein
VSAEAALTSHCVRLLRRGALVWGLVFAVVIVSSALGYRSAYTTAADRLALTHTLGTNGAIQALFGRAHRLDTVGGFTAWRSLGLLTLVGPVWGILASTRLMRGEEEDGRLELVGAGRVRLEGVALAAVGGLVAAAFLLWIAAAAGGVISGFSVASSLFLALALVLPISVFMAVGALCAQLATSRRLAAALAGAAFGAAFVLRAAADGSAHFGWVDWLTPLGWAELLRPLTGPRALPLAPLLGATAVLFAAAAMLAGRRDLGAGLVSTADSRPANPRGLGSTTAQAARLTRGAAIGWSAGLGLAAFVFGLVAKGAADLAAHSPGVRRAAAHFHGATLTGAAGYLGITFLFLMLALGVYVASELSATREEEASGRLDLLLARPVERRRWLVGRLAVGAVYAACAALAAGLLAWAGAASEEAGVPLDKLLAAAANCMPVALLFLGIGALLFGILPRHSSGLTQGLVAGSFLLELVGSTVKAPAWLLDLSPFHHVALVPGGGIDAAPALAMLALGLVAGMTGVAAFARRDLAQA